MENTLEDKIKTVIAQNGFDIIEDERLFNILADYKAFQGNRTLQGVFRMIIRDGYIKKALAQSPSSSQRTWSKFLGTITNTTNTVPSKPQQSDWQRNVKTYAQEVEQKYGYERDVVEYAFDCILYGMGWIDKVESKPVDLLLSARQKQIPTQNKLTTMATSTLPSAHMPVSAPSMAATIPSNVQPSRPSTSQVTYSNITDTQYMIIHVEPANSDLYVNGNQVQLKNGCWIDELKIGKYKIEVKTSSPDYLNFSQVAELTLQKKLELQIKLKESHPMMPISILNKGIKCDIYIDGVYVGCSPWSGDVRAGVHNIEVRRDKFKPIITTIDVNAQHPQQKGPQKFNFLPTEFVFGDLKVNSNGIGDAVLLDCWKVGTTPLILHNVDIGRHRVAVEIKGVMYEKYVDVEENRMTVVDFDDTIERISCDYPLTRREIVVKGKTHDICLTINGTDFCMKYVEGGTFMMGATPEQQPFCDKDELPAHQVTVDSLFIGQTQVTQKQWQAIMNSNPSCQKSEDCPVDNISWTDCQIFINKLNALTGLKFRLPTESEWEFCARGGNNHDNFIYSGSDKIDEIVCHLYCRKQHHPVAILRPNTLGIYDMSGNVWEWCEDMYAPYNGQKHKASTTEYVLRGGSNVSDYKYCRVSARGSSQDKKGRNDGLRLVLDIP